jgi:hypothetical protein
LKTSTMSGKWSWYERFSRFIAGKITLPAANYRSTAFFNASVGGGTRRGQVTPGVDDDEFNSLASLRNMIQ